MDLSAPHPLSLPLLLLAAALPAAYLLRRRHTVPRSLPSPLPGMHLLSSPSPAAPPCPPHTLLPLPTIAPSTADIGVVFVPGAGGVAAMYCRQALLFAPGGALTTAARALFYDHPGHAARPHDAAALAPAALVAELAGAVDALLGSFPAERRKAVCVLVVAHSYGCAVVLRALLEAAAGMGQVAGVVMLAPPVRRERRLVLRRVLLGMPAVCLEMLRALDRMEWGGGGAKGTRSVRRVLGQGAGAALAEWQLVWNRGMRTVVAQALGRRAEVPREAEYAAAMAKSGVKLWVAVGERDRVCAPSGAFGIWRTVAAAAPGRGRMKLVEGDVGHQVMLEKAEVVNEIVCSAVHELAKGIS